MTTLPRYLAASLLLLASSAVQALEGTRPAYSPPPVTVNTESVMQMIFSLLLVLAAIVAVSWLFKRMNLAQQGTGNLLKVIGSVAIGQRERAVLIEINDTWLVVGVGPGQIRTLHTLAKTEDSPSDNQKNSDNKFARMLAPLISKRNADPLDSSSLPPDGKQNAS